MMAATCIYCGYEVRYGSRFDVDREEAHQVLIAHDQVCPKNPVVLERDQLRRNRDMYKGQVERQAEELEVLRKGECGHCLEDAASALDRMGRLGGGCSSEALMGEAERLRRKARKK